MLVVDFGAQYAQLIARRVREAHVYSEIVPHTTPAADMLAQRPSRDHSLGRPGERLREGAPRIDPAIFGAGRSRARCLLRLPGMAITLGGVVKRTDVPSSAAPPSVSTARRCCSLASRPSSRFGCPTGRGRRRPRGLPRHRQVPGARRGGVRGSGARLFGVQWHPEVMHTAEGQAVIERFLLRGRPPLPRPGRLLDPRRCGRVDSDVVGSTT